MTDASNTPGKERREHKRVRDTFIVTYKLNVPLPVSLTASGDEYAGVAMDISEGGMAVDVDREIPPGTVVQLRFEMENAAAKDPQMRRRLFRLEGQTRHCSTRTHKYFRLGVLFSNLTEEERVFIAAYIKDLALNRHRTQNP
jgi:c-di-GMP-binding flagellar brake protein YcgR